MLDPTFGGTGLVTTNIAGFADIARAVVLQPDGKIVAGGTSADSPKFPQFFTLVRYLPNGILDPAFGVGGIVITKITGGTNAIITGMALQPDGRILAVGNLEKSSGGALPFAVLRFKPDGILDPTFGTGGVIIDRFKKSDSESRAYSIVFENDVNRIFVAGSVTETEAEGYTNFGLACYALDGGACAGFGDGGKVTTDFFLRFDRAYTVAVDPIGRILVGGQAVIADLLPHHFALARYRSNGSLDKTFGAGGKVTTDMSSPWRGAAAYAIVIQPDGKIILAGTNEESIEDGSFAMARYLPDGSLDLAFGGLGTVLTALFTHSEADAMVIQPDGKIVLSGWSLKTLPFPTYTDYFTLLRYDSTGALDFGFGTGGIVTTEFAPGSGQRGHGSTLQPDGKIVLVGEVALGVVGGSLDFALARYCLYQTVAFPVSDRECEDSQPNPPGTPPNPSPF